MSTEIAIIRRAREIISDPEKWTTKRLARDSGGNPVEPWDGRATCWCALGAMERAALDLSVTIGADTYGNALDRLYEVTPDNSVADVNDHRGHAAVLSLFNKALASEVFPMTLTVESWIEALESGKYKQAQEQLRDGDCFCCLGVACDLSGAGEWADEDAYQTGDTTDSSFLPAAVQNLLGLTTNVGSFSFNDLPTDIQKEIFDAGGIASGALADLNDQCVPFHLIAKVIRARPKGLFCEDAA